MNANSPKLLQNAWLTAFSALALLLLLAGCGGDAERRETDTPRIEATAAKQLADASDEIARLVGEGRECDAAHKADEFLAGVEAEIADGSVPRALSAELRENALALQAELTCEPPPQAEEEDEKGKSKDKKKDEEEDD